MFEKVHLEEDGHVFSASNGWLGRFKRCHGIKYLKISGEILSNDVESVTNAPVQICYIVSI